MAENNKKKKFQKRPWTPGSRPESRHQQAEAFKALREKLEGITGKPATESEVSLNVVLWEVCNLFSLSDSQVEVALGKEGVAAIQAKLSNAVWH